MPHKVGNKWKWGNVERNSKKELAQTVYGIWKKNGSRGDFETFWKSGKVVESHGCDCRRMLDFQLNDSIREAYRKMCENNMSNIDEGSNDIPDSVSIPTGSLNSARERKRLSRMTPEERKRENEMRENEKRVREEMERENNRRRSQTFISPSDAKTSYRKPRETIGPSRRMSEMRSAQQTDPGMRLGKGVYQGLEYAPGMLLGKLGRLGRLGKLGKIEDFIARGVTSPLRNLGAAGLTVGSRLAEDELKDNGYTGLGNIVGGLGEMASLPLGLPGTVAGARTYDYAKERMEEEDEEEEDVGNPWDECEFCGETFTNKEEWVEHLKNVHRKRPVFD